MSTLHHILITGTSSGIGLTLAEHLAERGHTVVASMREPGGRNAAAAERLRDHPAALEGRLHVVALDVADDASVEAGVAEAISLAGGIGVLVNNAGYGLFDLIEATTIEQAQALFNINFFGALRMNRALLPHLRAARRGLVVQISSTGARAVVPAMGIYTASKAALEAMTEAMRYELAITGVDAVIVEPGALPTRFAANVVRGADPDRATGYGPLADLGGQMRHGLATMFDAMPHPPGPLGVAEAVERLLQTPPGQRPLRTVVDPMMGGAIDALNRQQADLTAGQLGIFQMQAFAGGPVG